jgi:hypothetical protein
MYITDIIGYYESSELSAEQAELVINFFSHFASERTNFSSVSTISKKIN